MIMFSLDTNFLEVSAHAWLKVGAKSSSSGKKYKNLSISEEEKTEECNQKD